MFPELFSVGPLSVQTYGFFMVLGVIIGLLVALLLGKGQGMKPLTFMDMAFMTILFALLGSRLVFVLMNISYYREHPLDVMKIWEGGLVFSGGLIAALLALGLYLKRHHFSFWKAGDLLAPSAAVGQGIGRLGCFFAGCCYGKPTDLRWGVVFTHPNALAPLNMPLHPTQLYAALSGFIIFIVLLWLHKKKKFEGQILLWFLILHSTSRLFLERFRGEVRGTILGSDMTLTQWSALLILFAAVIGLFIRKSKPEEPPAA